MICFYLSYNNRNGILSMLQSKILSPRAHLRGEFLYCYSSLLVSMLVFKYPFGKGSVSLRNTKTFFKKIHSRGKDSKYYTSRMFYIPLFSPKSSICGTKTPKCRRFLQHYYRNTKAILSHVLNTQNQTSTKE